MDNTQAADELFIRDGHFVDAQGRVRLLRGVNLGGSSKLPYGYGHTNEADFSDFYDGAANVSFVNRPFPIEDADLHFARLKRWGLTFLRFIVTWEAIEHEGPGIYDRDYLAYIRAVVEKAAEYGMQIYIDPHQDVWSRWTGGDGAPMWTLECVGFEPRNFETTKAALCLETTGKPASEFPKMIWPTNYFKLATATMFTLFWGGAKFAPKCHVNGIQVQEFLQSHYINALTELAKSLKGLKNVAGFGTMNEPSFGYIGVQDLAAGFGPGELRNGLAPTPFQGMILGEGIAQTVDVWTSSIWAMIRGKPSGKQVVDPHGVRAWKSGSRCIWMNEGVWRFGADGKPELLKPDHFAQANFGKDFYVPFTTKFTQSIQSVFAKSMIFVEMPPMEFNPSEFPDIDPKVVPNAVNAMHWYDGVTLILCSWSNYFTVDFHTKKLVFGMKNRRQVHEAQLQHINSFGKKMHNAPTLIGEVGIPYNLNKGRAYNDGDFMDQISALDHTISCLEANMLSFTLWCYAADNSNKYGDLWNLEDLSLVSPDTEKKTITKNKNVQHRDDAARALVAFSRPHATRVAGIPLKSRFSLSEVRYELQFTSSAAKPIDASSEVFVPYVHYPKGYKVTASDGKVEIVKHDGFDLVRFQHDARATTHSLVITSKDPNAGKTRKTSPYLIAAAFVAAVSVPLYYYYERK
uniref:Glycoside hydrolase family 5 domain-containing protein n=1 Tax=Globisporangium ultimum (strain ATCC 200006 / CBS 805.95 / DAOM BR144) TaxID=431595 RepID=K3WLL7_GLOUD